MATTKALFLRLPPEIHDAITEMAQREYRSATKQGEMILRQWYEDRVTAEATPTAATTVTAEPRA